MTKSLKKVTSKTAARWSQILDKKNAEVPTIIDQSFSYAVFTRKVKIVAPSIA